MFSGWLIEVFFYWAATDGIFPSLFFQQFFTRVSSFMISGFWNVLAIGLWGMIHSLSAQPSVQTFVGLNPPFHLFVFATAWSSLVLALVWRYEEHPIIWDAFWLFPGLHPLLCTGLNHCVNIFVMKQCLKRIGQIMQDIGNWESNERTVGKLKSDGAHGVVRHPVYSYMYLFLFATLRMTFSRLTIIAGFTFYLIPGIIWEEQRLKIKYGDATREYFAKVRNRVIPYIW